MAFLNGVSQIRAVNWGRQYLWDIKFQDPDIPKTFQEWFPAQDIEDSHISLEEKLFDGGMTTFKIPNRKIFDSVKLTFVDDAAYSLFSFFDKWMDGIVANNGQYVVTLTEAIKTIQIVKLDHDRSIVTGQTRTLKVFPTGNLTFHGSNSADPHSYSITLVVAGKVTPK